MIVRQISNGKYCGNCPFLVVEHAYWKNTYDDFCRLFPFQQMPVDNLPLPNGETVRIVERLESCLELNPKIVYELKSKETPNFITKKIPLDGENI